jgi:23S rRNA pseudouridine1911/1915/1917 synthase
MNQGWIYKDRIRPQDAGSTVLDFYAQRYRHSSGTDWQRRIECGQVLLNGQRARPEARLSTGQRLEYHRPAWEEPEVPLHVEEIYSDDDVLVIQKPGGMPVLPGGNFLHHTLLHQMKLQYPDNPPVPVHRLGRGTSGLMVLARSPLARSTLSRQFRASTADAADPQAARPMGKIYRALLGPGDLPDQFTVATPIGRLPHPVLGFVYGAAANGLPAYSQGQVLCRTGEATLVEVTIRTGRPHQIRIHMAAMGYPLLGDPLYGVDGVPLPIDGAVDETVDVTVNAAIPVPGDTGYWLHAYRLHLLHPRTQRSMTWTCPPPTTWPLGMRDQAL